MSPLTFRRSRSVSRNCQRRKAPGEALHMAKQLCLRLKEGHTAADASVYADHDSCLPLSISGVVSQVCGT